MIISAHQPAYIPWLGYFHKIATSDKFVILDDVQFEKNSFINRNYIKTNTGPLLLTVPVLMKNHCEKSIREMEINPTVRWQEKHLKSIQMTYKSSPYFSDMLNLIEPIYLRKYTNFLDISMDLLNAFLKYLNIDTPLILQSTLKTQEVKAELILEICKKLDADSFLFGKNGKDYVCIEDFVNKGVKPYFQDYTHPIYKQIFGDFLPNMGIVDIISNVPKHEIKKIIFQGNVTNYEK